MNKPSHTTRKRKSPTAQEPKQTAVKEQNQKEITKPTPQTANTNKNNRNKKVMIVKGEVTNG